MSKRSTRSESLSNAANKRQAVAPQDEGPLLSVSSSSSLTQQAPSLFIPNISPHLIADLILPYIADRTTWNNVYSASKELCLAAKKMTPPWPNKSFKLEHSVRHVAFSPSGSQLAFCMKNEDQYIVHVWDRWGKETLLGGHTEPMYGLEYSLDGENLASGSKDGSIRVWSRESCDTTSSQTYTERSTRTPKQADKIILGSRSVFKTLSFSRTDSNLLASGGLNGEIKVWNVKEQACVHSFLPGRSTSAVRSLFFAGGADIACLAVAHAGSIVRFWRACFASEVIGEADIGGTAPHRVAYFPSGSFRATSFGSKTGNAGTVELYELETMNKTQSVVMPDFTPTHIAVTSDSKQLVVGDRNGRIRLLQTCDLSIQRDLDTKGEATTLSSIASDPTCQVLAFGYQDGRLELRTL